MPLVRPMTAMTEQVGPEVAEPAGNNRETHKQAETGSKRSVYFRYVAV